MSLRCCTDVMFSKYASAKKNAVQAKNARTPTKMENPHTLLSPLYQQVPMYRYGKKSLENLIIAGKCREEESVILLLNSDRTRQQEVE